MGLQHSRPEPRARMRFRVVESTAFIEVTDTEPGAVVSGVKEITSQTLSAMDRGDKRGCMRCFCRTEDKTTCTPGCCSIFTRTPDHRARTTDVGGNVCGGMVTSCCCMVERTSEDTYTSYRSDLDLPPTPQAQPQHEVPATTPSGQRDKPADHAGRYKSQHESVVPDSTKTGAVSRFSSTGHTGRDESEIKSVIPNSGNPERGETFKTDSDRTGQALNSNIPRDQEAQGGRSDATADRKTVEAACSIASHVSPQHAGRSNGHDNWEQETKPQDVQGDCASKYTSRESEQKCAQDPVTHGASSQEMGDTKASQKPPLVKSDESVNKSSEPPNLLTLPPSASSSDDPSGQPVRSRSKPSSSTSPGRSPTTASTSPPRGACSPAFDASMLRSGRHGTWTEEEIAAKGGNDIVPDSPTPCRQPTGKPCTGKKPIPKHHI